jgi:phosphate-selective porin OprO/OprP
MLHTTPKRTVQALRALAAITVLAAAPVHAANDAMMQLLKVLKDKGTLDEATYEALVNAAKADDEHVVFANDEVKRMQKENPKIKTDGKLEIATPDGKFKYSVGGRLMVDVASYDDDKADLGAKTSLGSGQEVRRARLHANGTMWKNWDWKVELDFANNAVDFKNNTIAYTGFKPLTLSVGNQKTIGLETLTSSRYITFMERALPVEAFVPEERISALGLYAFPMGTVSAGINVGNDIDSDGNDSNEGLGAHGRATFAPIATGTKVAHVGGNVFWKHSDDDDAEFRFRSRPESHVTDDRLVDTGAITAGEELLLLGAEAAAVYGPFSLQGEYWHANVGRNLTLNSTTPRPDLDFSGWYVYGSWFITGESRVYKVDSGKFDRVKPRGIVGQGGWGAWELGLRFSSLELNDSHVISGTERGILGGTEENLTVGLNWYATPNIRFMANYVKVLDIYDPNSNASASNGWEGARPSAVQMRAQVDF